MNDFHLLERLGESLDPPGGEPPDGLRGHVMARVMSTPERRRSNRPRLRWGFGIGAATAAAVVGALVLGQSAFFTGAAPPPAQTPAGPGSPAPETAAHVLQLAAQHYATAPAPRVRANQFVFTESVTMDLVIAPKKPNRFEGPFLSRSWESVDGTRDGKRTSRPLSGGKWTTYPIPGCHNGKATGAADRPGTKVRCTPDPGYRALPTDPAKMLAYLYRIDDPTDTYLRSLDPDERAFLKASYALYLARPAPAAQAAVLQAVSRIPGVTLVPEATDMAGRPGIAVARTGDNYREELVFDAKTYAYHGFNQEIFHRPPGIDDQVWTENLTVRTAIMRTAIVDRLGDLP